MTAAVQKIALASRGRLASGSRCLVEFVMRVTAPIGDDFLTQLASRSQAWFFTDRLCAGAAAFQPLPELRWEAPAEAGLARRGAPLVDGACPRPPPRIGFLALR
jgi:hypothetical protein